MVYHGDVVYQDQSALTAVDDTSSTVPGRTLYTCDLVPNYWNMICNSSDPTEFIIEHNIVRGSSDSSDTSGTLFSAIYKFRYMPEKGHSLQSSFATVNSGINTYQGIHTAREYGGIESFDAGNISELPTSYDSKVWQDSFDTLSLEQRGYSSLPATPCQWDDYGSPSIAGSSSSSSSPTQPNFPPHSQFYPSYQV
jgi:transcriptional enhancer factor